MILKDKSSGSITLSTLQVPTLIARSFFTLLQQYFQSKHKYHKLMNKHNINLSYPITNFEKTVIHYSHPQLSQNENQNHAHDNNCNSRILQNFTLKENCFTSNIICNVTITAKTTPTTTFTYKANQFKARYD